jgi:putative ABC transport system permease protein
VAIQIVVALAVPLLAALVPVIGGARISSHQAISNYGLGGRFGQGWFDRVIGRVRFLSRPMALSLRNTFRRKARVLLTLLTLTLGGVMFIMVMSVGNSMTNTIEVLLQDFGYDAQIGFERFHSVGRLVEVTESVPGVARAEVWGRSGATLALPNGEEQTLSLRAVPPDSAMFSPRVVSGRKLLPGDGHAILLNHKIAVDQEIRVGEEITLTVGGRESVWTVVGLMLNINAGQRECAVPISTLAREAGSVNRGGRVVVLAKQHDADSQEVLVNDLREIFTRHHMEVAWYETAGEIRAETQAQFNLINYLLLTMAILAAVVGSLGLMGTMSINVVERGREIGVMRSTGATSLAIAGIVISEGMLLGMLSWLLAIPISYPGAVAFSSFVGSTLFELPLDFRYSVTGASLWLIIVVVLSTLGSLWPALRATKVSVREALAYE